MEQPDSQQHRDTGSPPAIGRLAALGGLGFLVTSVAGDLLIGAFPRPDTPSAQLVSFYAVHHTQLLAAGMLLALSGIFFALFGAAVWARIRQAASNPMLAGLAMIGTALVTVTTLASAGTYGVLGDIGGQHAIAPAALQAWHIMASAGSLADGASTFLFLVTAAAAGLLAPALPRWVAWPALPLAVLQLLPGQVGFLASLVFVPWAAAAGASILFSRPARRALPSAAYATTQVGIHHA